MEYILYLALGAMAGLVGGLFGLGGGVVIVPILIIAFELQGISHNVATHMAVSTSLASIIFTSIPQFTPMLKRARCAGAWSPGSALA